MKKVLAIAAVVMLATAAAPAGATEEDYVQDKNPWNKTVVHLTSSGECPRGYQAGKAKPTLAELFSRIGYFCFPNPTRPTE